MSFQESDYVNVFSIEGIERHGMFKFESDFLKHLIDIDPNIVIDGFMKELEIACQIINPKFKINLLDNNVDSIETELMKTYESSQLSILVVLYANIGESILEEFDFTLESEYLCLTFPTKISKILI